VFILILIFSPPQTTITGDDLKPVSEIKLPDKPVDETILKVLLTEDRQK